MKRVTFRSLPAADRRLADAAAQAAATAYCPYSGVRVGAALLPDGGGDAITGSNVENAAYGSTVCAERAALLRANAMGLRKFRALAVTASGPGVDPREPAAPCGACRQMLHETAAAAGRPLRVVLASADRTRAILTTIRELLPLPFALRGPAAKARRGRH